MTTTEKAAQKLKDDLVRRFMDQGIGFRVITGKSEVRERELRLKMDRALPTDRVVESHGIRILLDPTSASVLERYELDYKEEPSGFCLTPRD